MTFDLKKEQAELNAMLDRCEAKMVELNDMLTNGIKGALEAPVTFTGPTDLEYDEHGTLIIDDNPGATL